MFLKEDSYAESKTEKTFGNDTTILAFVNRLDGIGLFVSNGRLRLRLVAHTRLLERAYSHAHITFFLFLLYLIFDKPVCQN
jgi:hypothetical protein